MNLLKRYRILFHERTMKELAPSYDRDAETRTSQEEADKAYKIIQECIQPYLSPLEAERVRNALVDTIYRVETGDEAVRIQKINDDTLVADMLSGINTGD